MDVGDILDDNQIFITGYAKLPQGITAAELYHIIAVGIIVDGDTGEIFDVDCTLVTRVAREYVKKLCVGRTIDDMEVIEKAFNEKYFGSARKALISALRTCSEKFKQRHIL